MDKSTELKKKLRQAVGAEPNLPITATVVSVQGETCTVEFASGFTTSDVKLKATVSEVDNYVLLTPKVGTKVQLLSLSGDLANLMVFKIDEVEVLEYSQDGLKVFIDSRDGKVSIQNETVSLKEVLTLLATLLKELKVFTPSGPSGTPLPDTITRVVEFETKFNQLLKEV